MDSSTGTLSEHILSAMQSYVLAERLCEFTRLEAISALRPPTNIEQWSEQGSLLGCGIILIPQHHPQLSTGTIRIYNMQ
jgi:hypothetical protein